MFGKIRQKELLGLSKSGAAASERAVTSYVSLDSRAHSAYQALAVIHPVARDFAPDCRLYLILSDTVDASGLAPTWRFYYLFPELRAEGEFSTESNPGDTQIACHRTLKPYPEPGTPEHIMLSTGGAYMAHTVDEQWRARLERLPGLPTEFLDSPSAVDTMRRTGQSLFGGGTLRLKGRRLPGGDAVWEAVTPSEVIHVPFAAAAARHL